MFIKLIRLDSKQESLRYEAEHYKEWSVQGTPVKVSHTQN